MKYIIFILLFTVASVLTAEEFPIMMQLKTDLKIPEDFRGGVESGLTENGYSLVSEEDQSQTLKEQATQRKKECYDESCLVDVGKMLAAKGLVMVEVAKKNDNLYLFKAKYIDFETGTTQKTVTEYFEYDLNNFKELNKFGKEIVYKMFNKANDSKNQDFYGLVITSDTDETLVALNGKNLGKANMKLELPKGKYIVKLFKSYSKYSVTVFCVVPVSKSTYLTLNKYNLSPFLATSTITKPFAANILPTSTKQLSS